jgi:hypothetical protein
MSSITTSDLNNYTILRGYLKDLHSKIVAGKVDVTPGSVDFNTFHDKLFPAIDNTYTNKLTTDANGEIARINADVISLKNLLHNTLYPAFNQTINDNTSPYTTYANSHIASSNKEHLCFIKLKADKTDIEPDKYTITNILYSKYAIEIFIKIIEALKNCYENYSKQLSDTFSSATRIFIVDRKLKNDDTDNVPKGIFIKGSENEIDSPPSGLYLYIGNLQNMFNKDDLTYYESNMSEDAVISESIKSTYLVSTNTFIFKSNDKLNYAIGSKYYFGYLSYLNNDNSSKYQEQTGTSSTSRTTRNSATITGGSGATINSQINDALIRTNIADLNNFKLKNGTRIDKISGKYKIDGNFDSTINTGTLTGGNIPVAGNTITKTGSFTLDSANAGYSVDYTTTIISGTISSGTISSVSLTGKQFDSGLFLDSISGTTTPALPSEGQHIILTADSDNLTLTGTSPLSSHFICKTYITHIIL